MNGVSLPIAQPYVVVHTVEHALMKGIAMWLQQLISYLKPSRIDFNSRPDRTLTGDLQYDEILNKICTQLAIDLGVEQSKLHADDRLREDLGYVTDRLGLRDELEDLVVIALEGDKRLADSLLGCRTIGDVARLRCYNSRNVNSYN